MVDEITQAARRATGRHVCVLVNGMEKMNGESAERFEHVFTQTRLLLLPRWAAVFAAPLAPIVHSVSADFHGYVIADILGFPPDRPDELEKLLSRRLELAGLNPAVDCEPGVLAALARLAGTLPRHALMALEKAVGQARRSASPVLRGADAEFGIAKLKDSLLRGLVEEDFDLLARVLKRGRIPEDPRAARLLATGCITQRPGTRFDVHPQLEAEVDLG